MQLIDTHCHLYLKEFESDIAEVMQSAEQEGVTEFYLPNIDVDSIDDMLRLESRFPDSCHAMMGLHPCSVKENYNNELMVIRGWLERRKFAAVGEIGLDFYWDKTFMIQQFDAFHQQVTWAKEYNIPIVIHSRNSIEECIHLLKEHQDGTLRGIFHCFTGSYDEACQVIELGLFLGIGGVITYKNSGLAETVSKISLDHIVLETDAPYLAPVPYRGKRNESAYLKYIVQKLSEIRNVSTSEIAAKTSENANLIFKSKSRV